MERAVIDPSTGEVVNYLNDGDRILRKTSSEKVKKRRQSSGRPFIKIDFSEGLLLLKELNPHEKSLLFTLQYYVSYESGLIRYSNGKDIGFQDIIQISGLSRRMTSEALNSLISKDIIYRGKNSTKVQYFMNPWVAMKGLEVNPTLKDMFKNYKIRSKDNICWKDLVD